MDYKKKIIEMLEKADHDQTYTISDLCVAFWELNKTTKGGGLLPCLNIRKVLLWQEKTLKVETSA